MQFEGSMRRFIPPVIPKGTKTTAKAAKQNSSLVSKIKTKIQNTSSFFKVSLKINNKALALALTAQKEKTRLLQTETVRLRKEVQTLCFDIAIRRHKHNQLVKLLKDLHTSALSSLVAAVDLVSNEDVAVGPPEEINNKSPPDSEDASMKLGSKVSRVPLLPTCVGNPASVSLKKLTRESSGSLDDQPSNPSEGIHAQRSTDTLPRVEPSIGSTCNKGTETVESIPPLQEKNSRPSNLQQELDKWSQVYLDCPPEPETVTVTHAVNPPPIAEPLPEPASLVPGGPSGSPTRQRPCSEKTTLFETEMEITLANSAAEIVTVETKKSRKEGVAKMGKKESTQAYSAHPPDKLERKNKKEKSSSICREATPSLDAPPTEGRSMMERPVSCLLLSPVRPSEKEEEPGDGDADWFPPPRRTHITSRNMKRHRHSRDAQKSVETVPREPNPRKTYVVSVDHNHAKAGSVTTLEDDYFINTEAYCSGIKNKEIPWDAAPLEDEGPKGKSRKTYVISTAQSGSSIKRKTYVISDGSEPKSRRTKALPARAENESAVEEHTIAAPAVEEKRILKRPNGPPRDPLALPSLAEKRKALFSEGLPTSNPVLLRSPCDMDGLIMEETPPWEILDPLSAVMGEPKPKRSRKESGIRAEAKKESGIRAKAKEESAIREEAKEESAIRAEAKEESVIRAEAKEESSIKEKEAKKESTIRTEAKEESAIRTEAKEESAIRAEAKERGIRAEAKERKQRDAASTDVKKKKKKRRKEPDDQASQGHSEARRPAPASPAGPEPKELWEPLGDLDIITDSVTSSRKNNLRKTNPISLDNCGGSTNSVNTIANIQLLEFPAAGGNEDSVNTVILAHVSADSNCAENTQHCDCSVSAETPSRVVQKEPNVQVNPEETGIPTHRSRHTASGKTSVASDHHAQGPASTMGQRSKEPPSRRQLELEKEVPVGGLSAGSSEETRESLKQLIMVRPFPFEPLDDTCTPFPQWDIPSLRPASLPPKPVLARVNVFEEQSDATTPSSPVVGRALKSLTNTVVTMDQENGRRRRGKAVSYKELPLNCKLRRGDKCSDAQFLNSPIFKAKKKKKKAVKLEIDTRHCFNNMD